MRISSTAAWVRESIRWPRPRHWGVLGAVPHMQMIAELRNRNNINFRCIYSLSGSQLKKCQKRTYKTFAVKVWLIFNSVLKLGSLVLAAATSVGRQPECRINFPHLDLPVHAARLWDSDKKAEPGTERVSLGSYYVWWMLQGKACSAKPQILHSFSGGGGGGGAGCHLLSRLPASGEDSADKGKMFRWQAKWRQGSAALISNSVASVIPMKYFTLRLLIHTGPITPPTESRANYIFFSVKKSIYFCPM